MSGKYRRPDEKCFKKEKERSDEASLDSFVSSDSRLWTYTDSASGGIKAELCSLLAFVREEISLRALIKPCEL